MDKPQKLIKTFRIESYIKQPKKANVLFITNIPKDFVIHTNAELKDITQKRTSIYKRLNYTQKRND